MTADFTGVLKHELPRQFGCEIRQFGKAPPIALVEGAEVGLFDQYEK
jgi:hypothetical protein